MSYRLLPVATYGDFRYVSWRLLGEDTTYQVNSIHEPLKTVDNRRHGNLLQAYALTTISADLPAITLKDALPFLHDKTYCYFKESVYYVYDPLLSKVRYTSIPGIINNSFQSSPISVNFAIRLAEQVGNYLYFVTGIEYTIKKNTPTTSHYKVFKPIAIRTNALHYRVNAGQLLPIANKPITDNSDSFGGLNATRLPALACCWCLDINLYPNEYNILLNPTTEFVVNEVYHVCTLDALTVGVQGLLFSRDETLSPSTPTTGSLGYFTERSDNFSSSFFLPPPLSSTRGNYYSDQLTANYFDFYDTYSNTKDPYNADSGVIIGKYGQSYPNNDEGDFLASDKTILSLQATFTEIYLQLPGAIDNNEYVFPAPER